MRFKFSNLKLLVSSPVIKKKFIVLQLLLFISCLFEVGGISLLGPLIYLASDPTSALETDAFSYLFNFLEFSSISAFILFFAISTIIFIGVGGVASFLSVTYLSKIATLGGVDLSQRVFDKYLFTDWSKYLLIDKSKMINEIYQETVRVTQNIFLPLLMINKSIFLCLILILFLITISWQVSLVLFIAIASIYGILFLILKSSLNTNSKRLTDAHQNRYKYLNDTFESMKQIHIWNNEELFQKGFTDASNLWGNALRSNMNISLLPRYVVETMILILAASGIVFLLIGEEQRTLLENLPSYSIFLFSAFKLLPAIQQIYTFSSTITGNVHSLNTLAYFLNESEEISERKDTNQNISKINLLRVKDIEFSYPDNSFSIKKTNLEFKRGQIIGITGYSGSGKSTFVDMVMGLLKPTKGSFYINDVEIDIYENKSWHEKISYLPPEVHLFNDTVQQNIHFSSKASIDEKKLEKALRIANLSENKNLAPNNYIKNINLSSGQVQRLGIARSIYRDHEVVIFDEPTSALDNNNKEHFISHLQSSKHDKITFFITHDLNLLQHADQIAVFNEGAVEYFGNFEKGIIESQSLKDLNQKE
tara:strand:+ start:13108 stop:14883 length:1776 start_codon:yes stop_codon:yes gene_type:complete